MRRGGAGTGRQTAEATGRATGRAGRRAGWLGAAAVVAIVCVLLPGSASSAPVATASAEPTAAYRHYVACGLSRKAKPSHSCKKGRKKGAFFRSNRATVFYTVCVKFPTGKNVCAPSQEAVQGTLYVNEITSNIPGPHQVTWFVKGKRVGLFKFTVSR